MDYQIEFTGVDTPELYRKVYWHMSRRGRVISLAIYVVAILLAASLYCIAQSIFLLILTVLYVLLAVWYQFRPLRLAKKAYTSTLKFNNGIIPPTTVRFGDLIVFQDVNASSVVRYSKIKKIFLIEEGMLMELEEDRVHFSAIDQFTKGSLQELKQFLRQKRPDLNIPE